MMDNSVIKPQKKNYFVISEWEPDLVVGTCDEMISEQEKHWRYIQPLQQQPFQRIAKYVRNKQYTKATSNPKQIRTAQALEDSLNYLINEVFILLQEKEQQQQQEQEALIKQMEKMSISDKPSKSKKQTEETKLQKINQYLNQQNQFINIAIFLQQTLKAIRCQYFVQGIICPSALIKLVKCMAVIYTIVQRPINLIGIQNLFDDRYVHLIRENYFEQYKQAVKTCLIFCNKSQIQKLLVQHQIILDDFELQQILRWKMSIQNGNYYQYFLRLSSQDPWIRCLLWSKIVSQRDRLKNILIKTKMSTQKSWLYPLFGYKPSKNESQDEWVNLFEQQQQPKKRKLIKYGYRNWINRNQLISIIKKQI